MGRCTSNVTSIRPLAAGAFTARLSTRHASSATPLRALPVRLSHKYGQLNARAVQTDLEQNHGRKVATSYIQNVAEWVGGIAGAKEELWEYELPPLDADITTIVISLDGAMIPMADSSGYREAMVGALSLYDGQGERQHTLYLAAAPEYGKAEFKQRMEREIARLKQQFPEALYLGIADGAATNWAFLEQHTEQQLIDFFHASEYVAKIARAAHPQAKAKAKREHWQSEHCSRLKHQPDAVTTLIDEATQLSRASHTLPAGPRRPRQRPDLLRQSSPPDGLRPLRRRRLADRLGRHRGRVQDPRQAAPVRLRHALEERRRQDRAQLTRPQPNHRALDPVLAAH